MQMLDQVQLRVLGCLIEKQRTTPDQYPLSLNALRLACNQATNREPVVEYDDSTVREAVQGLGRIGWARLASGPGSRAAKYRQLFDEALKLLPSETAVLGVLMVRGPQTVAELKARTERLHHFADAGDVEAALHRLGERELVQLLPRRPGQREERWTHLLSGPADGTANVGPSREPSGEPAVRREEPASRLEQRLERIEARLEHLERALGLHDEPPGQPHDPTT
jgi:uncharacterized protein YceH (UPF0502 family)